MRFLKATLLRPCWSILFTIILVVGISFPLSAQDKISITGQVSDAKSGMPLPGVNIQIQRSSLGTTSDLKGSFQLNDLAPGIYQLSFSMMGYAPYLAKGIAVVQGVPVELKIELKSNVLASPQVVVTSSRKAQDILESPFSVSAIGPREIQSKAIVKMIDILSYESGVSTIKGQLNIRGASGYSLGAGSRSLLLIDGIPMLGAAAGNVTWATVPTSEVDRVEIVKSGGSAMYGSSAMGGVVNIITRNAPPEPETRISTQLGVYSHPRVEQWKWRDSRGVLYNTELSHSRSFGDHAAWIRVQKRLDESFMGLSWEEALNISGKLKLNFGNAHSAALFVNILDDKYGLLSTWKSPADPFEAPVGSENDYNNGFKTIVNGHYNYVHSPKLAVKVRGSGYLNSWESFGVDTDYSNEIRYFGELQSSRTWSENFSSVIGLTAQQNGVEAQMFGEHESNSLAAYLLAQKKIAQVTFSLGGRWETYAVDGVSQDQVLSPQLALNWKPTAWMAMRVSTGKGFRVPTVAEMFTSARRSIFTVEPNPDLVSETSISREIGVTLLAGQVGFLDLIKFDMAIFHNKFNNLIEPVPDSIAVIHFQNISDARIQGMDVGLGFSLFDNLLDLKTAYTWLDPVETSTEGDIIDTLSYRYRHHWVNTLGLHYWNLDASLEYRYASKLESVELFQENVLTGQDERVPVHIWNAGLGTTFKDWRFLFRVENIFQYYYTQLERNMEEERLFTLTVERKL